MLKASRVSATCHQRVDEQHACLGRASEGERCTFSDFRRLLRAGPAGVAWRSERAWTCHRRAPCRPSHFSSRLMITFSRFSTVVYLHWGGGGRTHRVSTITTQRTAHRHVARQGGASSTAQARWRASRPRQAAARSALTSLPEWNDTCPTSMDAVFLRLAQGVYTIFTFFSLLPECHTTHTRSEGDEILACRAQRTLDGVGLDELDGVGEHGCAACALVSVRARRGRPPEQGTFGDVLEGISSRQAEVDVCRRQPIHVEPHVVRQSVLRTSRAHTHGRRQRGAHALWAP